MVEVSYTDAGDTVETVTSLESLTVANVNDAPTLDVSTLPRTIQHNLQLAGNGQGLANIRLLESGFTYVKDGRDINVNIPGMQPNIPGSVKAALEIIASICSP